MDLICFDMDNTLVYGQRLHLDAFKHAFKKHNIYKKREEIIRVLSLEGSVLVKRLFPRLSKKEIKSIVNAHDSFVIKNAKQYITVIPGAVPTLKKLKKKYQIALVSNCKRKEIVATLNAAKIRAKLFDAIIGSDAVRHGKPAPDMILKAKKILHAKKGYMVGDATYDIRAGKKAGMKTIAVCTGHHTRRELQKEKPFRVIKRIVQLKKVL